VKRLLFLVLMLGLIFAANADAALRINTPEGFVGRNSPVFTLNTTGGDTYGLRDKPGYVYVLEFWSIACSACKIAEPVLEAVHNQYDSQGVRVVGVNIADTAAAIQQYVSRAGLTYAQVVDRIGNVTSLFKVYATPTIVVIDRKGIVRDVHVGLRAGWEQQLLGLVSQLAEEG
jgi:peroxiredoxin